MRKPKPGHLPPHEIAVGALAKPETWWVEVRTTRWGYEAIGKSTHGRLIGANFDGWGGFPIWRPTERWALQAVGRLIRRHIAEKQLREDRDANARIYPVHD